MSPIARGRRATLAITLANIHPSLLPGARDKRQYKRGDNEADDSGYYRA